VSRKIKTIGEISISAIEDQWQRDATAAAIAGARGVIHAIIALRKRTAATDPAPLQVAQFSDRCAGLAGRNGATGSAA
jgi:hypothetical protein